MNYYERWTAATCRQLIDKGVLTQAEVDAKIAEIKTVSPRRTKRE